MSNLHSIIALGESVLIERIQRMIPAVSAKDVIIGIGDDTAAIRIDEHRLLLATNDIQLEGNHFRRDWSSPEQIGRKAMAVNLSDIAAMGGIPAFALVSLGLPADISSDFFDLLYQGIVAEATKFKVTIIGGNLAQSSEQIIVDITLLGFVSPKQILTRSNAKSGDRIFVSGTSGIAAAGLHALKKFGNAYPKELQSCIDKQLTPTPRVALGQALAESGLVTAMIDVSDGIGIDLGHICEASKAGCELNIEAIAKSTELSKAAQLVGKSAGELALNSGESYELLFAVRSDADVQSITAIAQKSGIGCTEIGRITSEQNGRWLVTSDGKREPLPKAGWDHFAGHI